MRTRGARRAALALAGAAALLFAAGSCGSKDSTGPVDTYVGGWEGLTSAGGVVRFYVESGGLPVVVVGIRVVGTTCTDSGTFMLHRESPDTLYPVTGSALTVTLSGTQMVLTLTGTFASPTQASGTLTVNSIRCTGTLNATWTATKASVPALDLTGTWTGTYSTSLVSSTQITINLVQAGSSLSGTYLSPNGAAGTLSGSVAGKVGKFTLTQTTAQCQGSFTGHAALVYQGVAPDIVSLGWGGSDCLGTHAHARGSVQRQ